MFRQISGSLNSVPSFVLFCFILFNKPDFECKERATKSEVRSLEGRREETNLKKHGELHRKRTAFELFCLCCLTEWCSGSCSLQFQPIHSFIQSFSVNSFIALHCIALHCVSFPSISGYLLRMPQVSPIHSQCNANGLLVGSPPSFPPVSFSVSLWPSIS